jgi:hypothetical protein
VKIEQQKKKKKVGFFSHFGTPFLIRMCKLHGSEHFNR